MTQDPKSGSVNNKCTFQNNPKSEVYIKQCEFDAGHSGPHSFEDTKMTDSAARPPRQWEVEYDPENDDWILNRFPPGQILGPTDHVKRLVELSAYQALLAERDELKKRFCIWQTDCGSAEVERDQLLAQAEALAGALAYACSYFSEDESPEMFKALSAWRKFREGK